MEKFLEKFDGYEMFVNVYTGAVFYLLSLFILKYILSIGLDDNLFSITAIIVFGYLAGIICHEVGNNLYESLNYRRRLVPEVFSELENDIKSKFEGEKKNDVEILELYMKARWYVYNKGNHSLAELYRINASMARSLYLFSVIHIVVLIIVIFCGKSDMALSSIILLCTIGGAYTLRKRWKRYMKKHWEEVFEMYYSMLYLKDF